MAVYSGQFFYLGNLTEVDTDEADFDSENPNAILGTYTLPSLVTVDLDDVDNNNVVQDDDSGGSPDFVDYDLGAGNITTQVDSSSVYAATATFGDSSTTAINVIVLQMQNGDAFVQELTDGDLDNTVVYSIALDSSVGHNYSGTTPGNFVTGASTAICFAKGTLIETINGPRAIETLKPGDLLPTRSGSVLPIHWITRRRHQTPGRNAPICIPAGTLGAGFPDAELRLSPQHRILVSSRIVQRMCENDEALLPAKALLEIPEVYQADESTPVEYFHLLLSSHQVITANSMPAETLYLGAQSRQSLPWFLRSIPDQVAAAPMITMKKGRNLVRRHVNNRKALWREKLVHPKSNVLSLHPRICSLARQNAPEPARLVQ